MADYAFRDYTNTAENLTVDDVCDLMRSVDRIASGNMTRLTMRSIASGAMASARDAAAKQSAIRGDCVRAVEDAMLQCEPDYAGAMAWSAMVDSYIEQYGAVPYDARKSAGITTADDMLAYTRGNGAAEWASVVMLKCESAAA